MWSSRPFSANDGIWDFYSKGWKIKCLSSLITIRFCDGKKKRIARKSKKRKQPCRLISLWHLPCPESVNLKVEDKINSSVSHDNWLYVLYLYFGRWVFTGREIGPPVSIFVFSHGGAHRIIVIVWFVDVNYLLIWRLHKIRRHHGSIKTWRSHGKPQRTRSSSVATDMFAAGAPLCSMRGSHNSIRYHCLHWNAIRRISVHIIFWFGQWFPVPRFWRFSRCRVSKNYTDEILLRNF